MLELQILRTLLLFDVNAQVTLKVSFWLLALQEEAYQGTHFICFALWVLTSLGGQTTVIWSTLTSPCSVEKSIPRARNVSVAA